ncbi:IS630 family transposase [Streptomyces sp. NPDC057325]|uniref:IS630 family transposase n=1 Tax=unclassified Streptomyces TaxID=2593676 RepID=UPI003643F923
MSVRDLGHARSDTRAPRVPQRTASCPPVQRLPTRRGHRLLGLPRGVGPCRAEGLRALPQSARSLSDALIGVVTLRPLTDRFRRALIRLVCGVSMTERGVGKWLRRHGFTPQRPARRSSRQKDDEVGRWLQQEYPAIRARASEERGELVWADQYSLRSDSAPPGRSWAPAGQTPLARANGRRFRVNVMSAVASQGALWFTVFPGKFNAKTFCAFLDRLARHARHARRKVHVIADRHPVHRSKAVRAWLAENAERVELHLMPGYSPEPNPDELLNADLKHHVHAARTTSADDIAHETRRFLCRRQKQPHIVCGYFAARHVRYTIQ